MPRYMDTSKEREEVDVAALRTEIASPEQGWAQARAKMQGHLRELGLTS